MTYRRRSLSLPCIPIIPWSTHIRVSALNLTAPPLQLPRTRAFNLYASQLAPILAQISKFKVQSSRVKVQGSAVSKRHFSPPPTFFEHFGASLVLFSDH